MTTQFSKWFDMVMKKHISNLGQHSLLITPEASWCFSESKLLPGVDICTSSLPPLRSVLPHRMETEKGNSCLCLWDLFLEPPHQQAFAQNNTRQHSFGWSLGKKCEKCEIERNNLDTATENTETNTKHEVSLSKFLFPIILLSHWWCLHLSWTHRSYKTMPNKMFKVNMKEHLQCILVPQWKTVRCSYSVTIDWMVKRLCFIEG